MPAQPDLGSEHTPEAHIDRHIESGLWARALDGERVAVEACARLDVDGRLARRHRVAAALALRASSLDLSGPGVEAWRRRLRQVTAHHLMLESGLERTGEALGAAGIAWLPIKGLDLGSRVYGRAEERPTSDIDVLIASSQLEAARRALEVAGYTSLSRGARVERYLRQEGYAWQARDPRGVLVELHYRLWGSVAPEVSDVLVARAVADPALATGGHRLQLEDAYLIAAVHLWLDAPPRQLGAVRDLAMIARADGSLAAGIVEAAERFDLQLPVLLAARWSAALWQEPVCVEVAASLESRLRRPERWWFGSRRADGEASYAAMTWVRHLARRRTRHSLARLVLRRLWAHSGIVEAATEGDLRPWPWRRLTYQLRAWGIVQSTSPPLAPFPSEPPPDRG